MPRPDTITTTTPKAPPEVPADAHPYAPRPRLRRLCWLTILATFSLIAIGGHVTSTDVGLAVPDGFTTFGHFTLTAPIQDWWYDFGTRWEHSHRLKGNLVGMMSIAMAVWLLVVYRDPTKDKRATSAAGYLIKHLHKLRITIEGPRPYVRLAGFVMLIAVIIQGVMGALRVSEISLTFAFIHGIFGQLILCGWVVTAIALSKPWLSRIQAIARRDRSDATPRLRYGVLVLLGLLLVQLTLGSAVRHFKADKAIPDFPLTYGQLLPPTSQEALDQRYAAYYAEPTGFTPEEAGITNRTPQGNTVIAIDDLYLQLAHRVGAVVVSFVGIGVVIAALRRAGDRGVVFAPACVFAMLLAIQFALGVMTVMTGTDPLMATMHQATGAALIAVATWLAVRIHLAEHAATPAIADSSDTQTIDRSPEQAGPAKPAAQPEPVTT